MVTGLLKCLPGAILSPPTLMYSSIVSVGRTLTDPHSASSSHSSLIPAGIREEQRGGIPLVLPAPVSALPSSNVFRLAHVSFRSPVPQALRLARHAEAVPVVGEVAVNTEENTEPMSTTCKLQFQAPHLGANFQPRRKAAIPKITG